MQKRQVAGLIVFLFTLGLIGASAYSVVVDRATSETIVVSGPVTSQGSVTIVDTLVIRNLANLPPESKLTINVPVYGNYADDGFSQSVTWHQPVLNPAPDIATDAYDTFNNHYLHYEWSLNGLTSSQFTATITSTLDYTITSDPQPGLFTDPFPVTAAGMSSYLQRTDMAQSDDAGIHAKAVQITAGATSEAEAVNAIMDFIRTQLPDSSSTTPNDAVSSLNSHAGSCKNRANLALALLRSVGIPARLVTGLVSGQEYHVVYVLGDEEHDTSFGWGNELHVWVEIYYPQKGTWVPYDPGLNKGFVDTRHVMSGTALDTNVENPATGGALYFIHLYANAGSTGDTSTSITFTEARDSGSYVFRSLDPSPPGILTIGRDMTVHPTVTPAPTPVPTTAPITTPTPAPNATVTPTPLPGTGGTVSPTPVPTADPINNGTDLTNETSERKYNISVSVTDALSKATLATMVVLLDGQPILPDAGGAISIPAINGTHLLTVSAPGYSNVTITLTVAGTDVVQNVRLSQAAGGSTAKPQSPGFELFAALTGLLIVALYRYGRA
jgi:hypothetical protein